MTSGSVKCPADAVEHATEHEVVRRRQQIPLAEADVTGRVKHGRLANRGAAATIRIDLELQPQSPGQLHLSDQTQHPSRLVAVDPPRVDGVADAQLDRVSPSPPRADT